MDIKLQVCTQLMTNELYNNLFLSILIVCSSQKVRRCMLVGVLSQIGLFSDTYFVSQMALMFFCCFPSSIIITIAAM